jgi:hypothetical protein
MKGEAMNTHTNRKEEARAGLSRAKAAGVQYREVGEAIGVPAGALRTFALNGKLGSDRIKALLTWLARQGYVKMAIDNAGEELLSEGVGEYIANQCFEVGRLLRSDVDPNFKTQAFTAFILQYHSTLETLGALLKKGKN